MCLSRSVISDSLQTHGAHSHFFLDHPDPGVKPRSPALQADSLPSEPSGKLFGKPKGHKKSHCEIEILSINGTGAE